MGGGLAFAALALVAGGYTAMRLLGIGPVGTLVASGVIKDREPIVLADFENRASDSTLGPSVTEAFRVDLSQSPTVRVMDQQAVARRWRACSAPSTGMLPTALARELAEREGVKAIVSGQIDPVGQGYVIAASLLSARRRADAERGAGDGRRTRRAAQGDRPAVGASSASGSASRSTTIRANPALDQVTTASLPALRKYSQALRSRGGGPGRRRRSPCCEEAVALDSRIRDGVAQARGPAGKHAARRTRCSVRRPRAPSSTATACRSWSATLRWGSITPTWTTIPTRSLPRIARPLPSILIIWFRSTISPCSSRSSGAGWRRKVSSLMPRRIGRGASFYNNLYQSQVAQGHFADAHATLARYAKVSPGSPYVTGQQSMLAAAERDWSTAERLVQQLRKEQSSSPYWHKVTTDALARVRERAGKLGEARPVLRRAGRRCRSAKLR